MKTRLAVLGLLLGLLAGGAPAATPQEDGDKGIREYEIGNLIEGMELMTRAAEAGYAPAQVRLGYILDQSEENEEAVAWFRRAAAQDFPDGLHGLGKLYAAGEGVDRDLTRARELFEKAAEQDHMLSIRVIAHAYEHGGLDLEMNWEKALEWYFKGIEAGDTVSARRLADAYQDGGLGLPEDPEQSNYYREMLGEQPLEQ